MGIRRRGQRSPTPRWRAAPARRPRWASRPRASAARPLLAGGDAMLTGALHHAGANVPARRPILVIGHPSGLGGDGRHRLVAAGDHRPQCCSTQAAVAAVAAPDSARPRAQMHSLAGTPSTRWTAPGTWSSARVPIQTAPSPSTAIRPARSSPRRGASRARRGPKAVALARPAPARLHPVPGEPPDGSRSPTTTGPCGSPSSSCLVTGFWTQPTVAFRLTLDSAGARFASHLPSCGTDSRPTGKPAHPGRDRRTEE